ncbi:sigma-70 family RNA polymerase sigma factor [Aquisphaera insulae]|uniref:sigma-70 family RNA polymerase sigma factor n=1 Tax=Aquisphaera insulae TaxID=2712864 RepID=UPI0013EDEAF5|nr:sigma-70 family RNA polymerase sigma factor [Aquisphaera insulae]
MAMETTAIAPGPLDRIFAQGVLTGSPDDRLLDRFLADRDGDAFAALVARHGPMVLRVALGTLRNPSDAEDTFQATFLILVQRASSLRGRPDLGGWLFRVAHRVALRANAVAARRQKREQAVARTTAMISANESAESDDLAQAVHAAIAALPEALRSAVLLCDLRGIPQRNAAIALKTSERTLRRRLVRARDRLKPQFERQGLAFDAAILAIRSGGAATVVPHSWSDAVVRAAPGHAAASASASVLVGAVRRGEIYRLLTCSVISFMTVVLAMVAGFGAMAVPPMKVPATGQAAVHNAPKKLEQEAVSITVSGKATDAEGKPVAGATVHLVSANFDGAPIGTATTDADGSYRFADAPLPLWHNHNTLPQGTFEVFATAPGHGFAWQGIKLYVPRPRPPELNDVIEGYNFFERDPLVMDLTLPRRGFLAGRVVDERRRPIVGASIRILCCDYLDYAGKETHTSTRMFGAINAAPAAMTTTRTDQEGRFHLDGLPAECGFYLRIENPSSAPRTLHAATTERPAAAFDYPHDSIQDRTERPTVHTGPILIVLDRARRVAVKTVIVGTKDPAAGIEVMAWQGDVGSSASGVSDADGRLELRLPPGEYDILAHRKTGESRGIYIRSKLSVAAEPSEQDFELSIDLGCVVNLEVIDADTRQGLPGVTFWSTTNPAGNNPRSVTSTHDFMDNPVNPVSDARGRLRAVMPPGETTFSVMHSPPPPGYQPSREQQRVTLRAGKAATVRFELRRAGP